MKKVGQAGLVICIPSIIFAFPLMVGWQEGISVHKKQL